MTAWLSVIGIGEDGVAGLSAAARALIDGAAVLVGGDRHLALVPDGKAPVAAATVAASAWVLTVASINSRTDCASGSYNARSCSTSSALMFSSVKSSMSRN